MIDPVTLFLSKYRPNYLKNELLKISVDCNSLLDVGCGENSVARLIKKRFKKTVGIDLYQPSIDKSKKKKIHQKYVRMDVRKIDSIFKARSFDCVMAIDIIEHLKKRDAVILIKKMEVISSKIVVLQTTNGFYYQGKEHNNVFQKHLCGFSTKELMKLGYSVRGIDGPKKLRDLSKKTSGIFRFILSIFSNLLDPIYRYFPKRSFNLFAYKFKSVK